ncbi:hypothetical protein [uncultured Megamonas sp.]|uniref:hypothetical protein n=1 Tax=uncultured Megamonas sp. TaxID=286140 RepID=UPI00259AF251|nr:hypothetical protein [uncultured Megamonas sp.]
MAKKKSFESKLKNNNLAEAFTNIAKGFEYLGEDNAQLLNKIKMNEDINADEIDVVLNKSRELSRLAQNYAYKIIDIFSKHYGFSFNQFFGKWLDKNNLRKYYEQNISADEILRNRKKDRHVKLPFCIKAKGTDLGKQFKKIAEEFAELGAENAIILNKIQAKQDISINNIKNTFFEAFDISQATQTYMYLIMLIRVNKKYEEDDWGWDK